MKVGEIMAYDGSIKIDTKIDTSGFSSGVEKMKSIASKGVSAMTTAFAAVTAGIAAGATAAATVGSSFEAAMSKVSAISGSTGKDLQALTDKAKEMGAKTKFSASESAEALQYMSMAGWDTKAMLSGIDGIMNLAAADGLDLATTSDIVTDALTAFGLKASDSSHFADVLAKASSSANTNVSMLGESFKYVAPLAGTMGYSVEDVSLALGLMANASVKGSMAGTSLKTALSNLASPTDQMAEVMNKYRISISDTQGNALPLIDVLKQLREKFGTLSETEQTTAASTLFGKEAMSGMLAIINASDSDFKNLTENINNADGAAQSMANTMQDNLQGQITILKSALEGLGIEIYEGMQAPLKDAAVEAQRYVNRLTESFTDGGLTGLIGEAGNIFGELAVKAAEAAPKMVEASIKFIQSFVDGIINNSGKLVSAAKSIIKTIVDNLVNLIPPEIQKPVKEFIKTLSNSFENGGLKKAINTTKTVLSNLAKVATNLAKTVLPPLAKAVDFVADNLNTLIPLAVSAYTAYKSWKIISSVTAMFAAQTAAVTAESLAEAASIGTIKLKQIAVGALTGEITLATAAQYAWNAAMNANPIGLVATAVIALTAGIGAMSMTMGESTTTADELKQAQEDLTTANENLGSSYESISENFSDFYSNIENAGSILDNFNDSILLSNEKQQELAQKMDEVQTEITEIAQLATDERRELTSSEIQRLDELFQKMHELSEQELAFEQKKQEVAQNSAKVLNDTHKGSVESYQEQSDRIANTAEETRKTVIDKATEQYNEELALLEMRLESDKTYTQKMFDADAAAAKADYDNAVSAANKKAADTLNILQKGYYDRADVLKKSTDELNKLNQEEYNEEWEHTARLGDIEDDYYEKLKEVNNSTMNESLKMNERTRLLNEKEQAEEEENTRYAKKIKEIRNDQQKILDDKNYQNQLKAFLELSSLYEFYSGETSKESEQIVTAFKTPMEHMPEDTKKIFQNTLAGAVKGLEEKSVDLYSKAQEIVNGVINLFTRGFDIHSPSKVFKKIFKYTLEGGEEGLKQEAPALYSEAEKIADTFTDKLKTGVSASNLVARMRNAVQVQRYSTAHEILQKSKISMEFSSNIMKMVEALAGFGAKPFTAQGNVQTQFNIDGREFAVAVTPFISEEMAWEQH